MGKNDLLLNAGNIGTMLVPIRESVSGPLKLRSEQIKCDLKMC